MKALVLLSLFIASPAFAMLGPQGSGGGKAVVCRSPKGKIKSVTLLDLWEAQKIYRYQIPKSKASVEKIVAKKLDALKYVTEIGIGNSYFEGNNKWSEPEFTYYWVGMIANMILRKDPRYIFPVKGAELVQTEDSFEIAVPKGNCKIEQIVNYIDSVKFPRILIDAELLAKMDNVNKAALYLHEAFYVYLRGKSGLTMFDNSPERNSIRVRRAIGYVFAGNSFLSLDSLLPERYVMCQGQNLKPPYMPSTFYVYNDENGVQRAITTQLFGKRMLGFSRDNTSSILPDGLVRDEPCDQPGPPNRNVMGPSIFNLYGSGPVDYQMQVWLGPACDKYKSVMMLMVDRFIGPVDQEAQQLSCSWVNKSERKK